MPLLLTGAGGRGGGGAGTTASNFLARTSGLDATHIAAYTALLDGLDTDGLTAKLDMLHVYATQDSTTANLNLIGNIYNATPVNSPTFTTDRGYTGSSSPKYIRTNFTPDTAVSPQFVQNSGHVSTWPLNNASTSSALVMGSNGPGSGLTGIHARFSDGNSYFYLNSTANLGAVNASSIGHFLANRSTSSVLQGYKNGSVVATDNASTSQVVSSREILVAGQNQNASLFGADYQMAMASIGSGLSSTDVTNFYNRLRTFMTAVGVP